MRRNYRLQRPSSFQTSMALLCGITNMFTYAYKQIQSANANIISAFSGTAATSPSLYDKGNGQLLGVSDADMITYSKDADVIIIANQYCSSWTKTGACFLRVCVSICIYIYIYIYIYTHTYWYWHCRAWIKHGAHYVFGHIMIHQCLYWHCRAWIKHGVHYVFGHIMIHQCLYSHFHNDCLFFSKKRRYMGTKRCRKISNRFISNTGSNLQFFFQAKKKTVIMKMRVSRSLRVQIESN